MTDHDRRPQLQENAVRVMNLLHSRQTGGLPEVPLRRSFRWDFREESAIRIKRSVRSMRKKVSDVSILWGSDCPNDFVAVVQPIASAADIVSRLVLLLAEKCTSLKVFGTRQAGQAQERRPHVHVHHQIIHRAAGRVWSKMLVPLRKFDDERNPESVVVDVRLCARIARTVVSPEKHNRIVGEAVLLEFRKHLAHPVIDLRHRVVEERHPLAKERHVRDKAGHRRIGRIMEFLLPKQIRALLANFVGSHLKSAGVRL